MGGVVVEDASGNQYGYPFSVGQYIPWFNGGVVYDISNNGANGYLVSVSGTTTTWGPFDEITNAVSENNGMDNMNTIKSLDADLSDYPAFKWCDDYGFGNWYLPAKNELQAIYDNRSTINSTLSANGYTTLGMGYYWSSTEDLNLSAYLFDFNLGNWYKGSYYETDDYKKKSRNVHAVLIF